jgi:MFS transporter, DHA1 family, inner membrane transport protein
MTRKEIVLLLVLAAIQLIHIVDFMILMPLGPVLQDLFHITPQQFGWLVSSYSFSAGVVGFLGATYADRFDRKQVLLFCFVGFTLGTFACSQAGSFEMLLIARIITGALGGLISSSILSIVSDVVAPERRAQGLGVVMGSFSVASAVGVPLALLVATRFGWNMPFLILVMLAVPTMLLVMWQVPPVRFHLDQGRLRQSPLQMTRAVLADGNQVRALLLMMFLMMAQFSVIPFIPTYHVKNVGFRQDQLFYVYLVGGICSFLVGPLVGKLADRKGRLPVYMAFAFASLVPVFFITHMGPIAIPIALAVTSLFFIVSTGRSVPAVAMVSSVVSVRQRGSFMSVNNAMQHLSLALGAMLGGVIVKQISSGINGGLVGSISLIGQPPEGIKTLMESTLANEVSEGKLIHYGWVGMLSMGFVLITILLARTLKPVVEKIPPAH